MRQKLPTLIGQVLLLTGLGLPNVLCSEQWSRPLSDRRSDDWVPIPKQPQTRQAEHARDLKVAASTVDQIGNLLTPPMPPNLPQQSRVLRNPAPQLTGNGFFNQQFKAPPQPPPKSPNQNFFQFTTPQSFPVRQQQQQQPAPSQQPFKNEAVNNQFNSFLSQDPSGFSLTSVPNQFGQPQQILFPQSHFPSASFFQNQAFGEEQSNLAGRAPQLQQAPKTNEPTRTSKVRFPEPNSGDDSREEIQLLYVPVETLQQRGRTGNKLKPNDVGKFKEGPPPNQPNFFPQQGAPQFPPFPQFPQFNQPEFPPIPQFIDDFNVKHRFNKPQEKPAEKPQTVFQNQFIPPPNFQQDFQIPPPKEQKFPQGGPPKNQQNFQQDFQKPPKVDFAALQQEFALPEKTQPNFQFDFQQQNGPPSFPSGSPQQQSFAEPPQNFPPPPKQNFEQPQQNFQDSQPKFTQPITTTPKSIETNFRPQEVSQALNEVAPTKTSFSESSPSQSSPANEAPLNPQQLPGMTLAQFAANEQFFPQFQEQAPDFSRPNFEPASQSQIPQSEPQFERRPPSGPFFQPPEQDVFRPSLPLPQDDFQNQQFNPQPQFPSGRVTPAVSTLPPPHQPPLSVYMENVAKSKVGEVLSLLKNSKTIPVLDNVGKDTPQIFVGPSSLEPPAGYVKFELPYLSSLDTNRIERKVDRLPFFVAPLNFQPPNGYSKIPFPAPHIGSVVVSNATILRAALHEKPFESQGVFEQSTPSQSIYTLPSEINSISPHLPSQVNSLQTTPRFAPEEQLPVTEATTQRRTRYRTSTPVSTTYQQRRPSTGTRQRKPLHRGFTKSQTSTTTTTEIPQEVSTLPPYVPDVSQTKTHFGSQDQFLEQTIVPANQQNSQVQQSSNDQTSQLTLDHYFQQQQRQQPSQQFDVPSSNQATAESGPSYNEQGSNSEVPQNTNQEQQFYNQGSQQYGQEQQTYSQEQKQTQDQYNFQSQKPEAQTEATPAPVEISSSNYQSILSPSQYHSEITGKDQYAQAERVPEQTPGVQQSVSSVEPTYQQNEQINAVNEQQYESQNQIDQNNYRPVENRFEPQPQQETTVASFVEINEQETDKPEKFTKTKNKFFEKTQEHKEYNPPDQSSILQAHMRLNAFLAQEQAKEQEIITTPQTTMSTEETTTKKLRGRVRGRQRYTGRTSTTESPEEQNYPRNFKTQEQTSSATRASQSYPVYQRPTESSGSEETSSSETPLNKADKYNTFKRRRPLIRPASTSTSASNSEEEAPSTTVSTRQTRVRVTKVPTSATATARTSGGRARLRRPGSSTPAASTTTSTTEVASTESLDWGTYVNSFAPSAGANEIASPYDDKAITFHNIESHRRNPSYNKVKNDEYWNNGVTIHQSEGVEVNPDTLAPTESTVAASRSYTKADTDSSATTRTLDRKALYRQRLRYGAVSNDPENVQAQQNQLKRGNAHKQRIAASKKLTASQDDSTYDANSLQQNEERPVHRGEEYSSQQSSRGTLEAQSEERQVHRGEDFDSQQNSYRGNLESQSEERQVHRGEDFDSQQNFRQTSNSATDTEQKKDDDSAAGKKAAVGRRRGAWVRVRVKKPQDVFETAESQSFAKLSGNALKNPEKSRPEDAGKEQYVKDVSVDQVSFVENPSQTYISQNPEQEEQKPEEYSNEKEESQSEVIVQEQDSPAEQKDVEETPKNVSEEHEGDVFQKDIGDMIREIINGESVIDEIDSQKEEVATEQVPEEKQESVGEMLVATTTPTPVRNHSTAATTPLVESAETTVISRQAEQEEVTTFPTTMEPESERDHTPEPVTRKIVSTSTTTEISLETEICYKGRCVKSKKTKATDLLPSE